MKTAIARIKHELLQLLLPKLDFKPEIDLPIEKMGSTYGEWVIPKGIVGKHSVCYLAGAGEDISFDVKLAGTYGCEVHIFDPTPRAKKHFDTLAIEVEKGNGMPLPHDASYSYEISKELFSRISFHEIGIWKNDEIVRFYEPSDETHVSHSILNLQKTESYIDVQVERLETIMERLGHKKIDVLKIDIEGAEYEVINYLLDEKVPVDILCVEFDEVYNPLDGKYPIRINETVQRLRKEGYAILYTDDYCNLTFVKR